MADPIIQGNTVVEGGAAITTMQCVTFTMPGVTIHFDPHRVELDPGVDWNGAGKSFWNTVARLVGQPPPFGW